MSRRTHALHGSNEGSEEKPTQVILMEISAQNFSHVLKERGKEQNKHENIDARCETNAKIYRKLLKNKKEVVVGKKNKKFSNV